MIVAEVITISSAMRVMVEKVPEPMVSMPSVSSARCDAGTMKRYHTNRNGMATNDGTSHFTLHFTSDDLSAGLFAAIDAAGADERPDAGQRSAHAGAQQQARPVGRIEECVPELAGLMSRAGHGEPGVARRQHEGENAVDDDQRADRRAGVDPAHRQVQLGVDLVPGVVVDGGRGQLDHEEDPLDGPAEDEVVNQRAGGLRVREADGKPDAHAGDGAEDAGKDEEELRVADQLFQPVGAALAQSLAFGQRQVEAAAHGELRNHDVEDGDDADHPARAEIWNVPKRIVHKN